MFHCCNSLPAEDLEAFAPTDTEKGWPEYMRVNCILVSMYIIVQRSSWAASFRPVRRILAHYCTQSVNKWQKAIKIDKLCFIYNICRILGWVYIYEVWECRCVTSGMWLVERTPLHFFDKVIYSYPALYSDILFSVSHPGLVLLRSVAFLEALWGWILQTIWPRVREKTLQSTFRLFF